MRPPDAPGLAAAAVLLAVFLMGSSAHGSPPPAPLPADLPDGKTVAEDRATVTRLLAEAQTGGFNLIGRHLGEVEAIIARAPSPFQQTEQRGSVLYVRTTSQQECVMVLLSAAAQKHPEGEPARSVACVDNPYGEAALMVGSYLDEVRRPQDGLAALNRGLALAPNFAPLIIEKGAALNMLHRYAEALAVESGGLALNGPVSPLHRGAMLRGEGFALAELKRYDEAEQAYRDSLKIDPDQGHAVNELAYIARMRKGGADAAVKFTTVIPSATPQ